MDLRFQSTVFESLWAVFQPYSAEPSQKSKMDIFANYILENIVKGSMLICTYHGVSNVSFSENVEEVLNEWRPTDVILAVPSLRIA